MSTLTERMTGAALLDVEIYEEVEHDTGATWQAALVVAIVAVCAGIGGVRGGPGAVLGALAESFVGWLLWAAVVYVIGTRLFHGTATWGELLRTMGFAQSPGVLYLLGVIPVLGWLAVVLTGCWLLVTVLVGVRQALDLDTGRALLTALVGWVVYVVLGIIVGWLLIGPNFI